MTKIGDAVSLSLNGAKFAVPRDIEPIVIDGGLTITEMQTYGDGSADGYQSQVQSRITGLKCKVSDENLDAFNAAKKNPSMPIVLECVSGSYELTGCIVGEVGVSATRRLSDEFEVNVTDGAGIRKS